MTHVAWVNYDYNAINRYYWDQGFLELLFKHQPWTPVYADEYVHVDSFEGIPRNTGGIVIIPAAYHVNHIEKLNYQLAQLPWVLLILTSDEESLFPWKDLYHDRMKMWLMTPRSDLHADFPGRFIGEYYKEACPETVAQFETEAAERPFDWYFSGQVTHQRRHECVAAAQFLKNGELNETPGFTQGFEYPEYIRKMASAKIALAPSGPGTPDSFRLYEALEAGCVPIVDASSPGGPTGYWDMLYPDRPFPVLDHWGDLALHAAQILRDWQDHANRCSSWWQAHKRNMAYALKDDVRALKEWKPDE